VIGLLVTSLNSDDVGARVESQVFAKTDAHGSALGIKRGRLGHINDSSISSNVLLEVDLDQGRVLETDLLVKMVEELQGDRLGVAVGLEHVA